MAVRHVPSSVLLVLLLAVVAAFPALYLVQIALRAAGERTPAVRAVLRVEDPDAGPRGFEPDLHLGEGPDGRAILEGAAPLQGPEFPWRDLGATGHLRLVLPADPAPGVWEVGDPGVEGRFAVTWTGEPQRRLPCSGRIEAREVRFAPDPGSGLVRLDAQVDLRCGAEGAERPYAVTGRLVTGWPSR